MSEPTAQAAAASNAHAPLAWPTPQRQAAFEAWLSAQAAPFGLDPASVVLASADASFRRYLRVNLLGERGESRIIMDAPPDKEDCAPFVRLAALLLQAGLNAPEVLQWDAAQGFMLLSDLGGQTLMQHIWAQPALQRCEQLYGNFVPISNDVAPHAAKNLRPLYDAALDDLVALQAHSMRHTADFAHLPAYDEALLRREMALYPDWYLAQHKGLTAAAMQAEIAPGLSLAAALQQSIDFIVTEVQAVSAALPTVVVHRDFMPRNLMMPLPAGGGTKLGVLDFQDAVLGPCTYDIASLMRDAFLSWDEETVLDITARYWQRARKAGVLGEMGEHPFSTDFGAFYRAVEIMGLQRHLKVMGIFARLTLRDGKPKYLADTPRFVHYAHQTAKRYHELAPLARLIEQVEHMETVEAQLMGRG